MNNAISVSIAEADRLSLGMMLLDSAVAVLLIWLSTVLVEVRKGRVDAPSWSRQAFT